MITLTLKGRPGESLEKKLAKLNKSFSKLRRREFWTDRVRSGIACIEVAGRMVHKDQRRFEVVESGWDVEEGEYVEGSWSLGENEPVAVGAMWHVHIHLVYDGDYIPQRGLSDLWDEITGGSYVVDVREVKTVEGAYREIAKYVFKEEDINKWTVGMVEEFETVMERRRLYRTFGELYGQRMLPLEKKSECPGCGAINSMIPVGCLEDDLFQVEREAVLWGKGYVPPPMRCPCV